MSNVSMVAAFGAGVLSFLSPCILPMVPVYLATLYGSGIYENLNHKFRVPLLLHSLFFVLGFSLIFTALGTIAGITGYAVNLSTSLLNKIAGSMLIIFGIFILAALKLSWLNYEKRLTPSVGNKTTYLRSFVIGAAFSLGWTACVGPLLGGILMLAAVEATAWKGASLLMIYCLGLGIPFLIMGIAFDSLKPLLKYIRKHSRIIQVISGLLLIIFGILACTDNLRWFAALTA